MSGVVNLESIPFIGNHALHYGGALALIDGTINTDVVIENADMENNTASRSVVLTDASHSYICFFRPRSHF